MHSLHEHWYWYYINGYLAPVIKYYHYSVRKIDTVEFNELTEEIL